MPQLTIFTRFLGLHFLFLSFFFSARGLCDGITITEVHFYPNSQVSASNRIAGTVSRNKISKLYARFTLLGSVEAIKILEESGCLPITAEWQVDGIVKATVEVGITQGVWDYAQEDLKDQVSRDDFFKYRTTTFKSNVPTGKYTLVVRDAKGNSLAPSGYHGLYKPTLNIIMP